MTVAITVSGSSSSVTPGGEVDRFERERVADLERGDVVLERVRDVARQRLDRELARDLLEHAALLDPGRVLGADQLEHHGRLDRLVEADAQQIDVDGLAADGVADELLEDDRAAAGAVDPQVEDRAGVGQRLAQLARVDRERDRVLAAAVDDAGHVALAPQPAGRARARRLALGRRSERLMSAAGHARRRW